MMRYSRLHDMVPFPLNFVTWCRQGSLLRIRLWSSARYLNGCLIWQSQFPRIPQCIRKSYLAKRDSYREGLAGYYGRGKWDSWWYGGLYLCRSITDNSGIGSRQYMSDLLYLFVTETTWWRASDFRMFLSSSNPCWRQLKSHAAKERGQAYFSQSFIGTG